MMIIGTYGERRCIFSIPVKAGVDPCVRQEMNAYPSKYSPFDTAKSNPHHFILRNQFYVPWAYVDKIPNLVVTEVTSRI